MIEHYIFGTFPCQRCASRWQILRLHIVVTIENVRNIRNQNSAQYVRNVSAYIVRVMRVRAIR